jgi:hypothetical protein
MKNERKATSKRGKALLNLRSKVADRIVIGIIVLLTIAYLWEAFSNEALSKGSLAAELLKVIFWIVCIAFIWSGQGRNCKLTENGLICFGSFFTWEDILAWKWSDFDKAIIVRVKGFKKQNKTSILEFNINKKSKNKVNEILVKYKGQPNLTYD